VVALLKALSNCSSTVMASTQSHDDDAFDDPGLGIVFGEQHPVDGEGDISGEDCSGGDTITGLLGDTRLEGARAGGVDGGAGDVGGDETGAGVGLGGGTGGG
jgi:hypothetical protein